MNKCSKCGCVDLEFLAYIGDCGEYEISNYVCKNCGDILIGVDNEIGGVNYEIK